MLSILPSKVPTSERTGEQDPLEHQNTLHLWAFNVEAGQSVHIQDLTWNILVFFGFSPSTYVCRRVYHILET